MTILQLFPDLICLAILLIFLIFGANRGIFRSLSGVMTWLVSLFGAKLIADRCAPLVGRYLLPQVQVYVTQRLSQAIADQVSFTSLSDLGLGVLGRLPGVSAALEQFTGTLVEAIAPTIALEVANALGWLLLLAAGFVVLKLVCWLLLKLLDLVDALPGLHFLNHFGGALLGALKGALALVLLVSILSWCSALPQELVDQTVLLKALYGMGFHS